LKRLPTELVFALLIALAAIALVFLTWANYRYSVQNPGGSDLLPRWAGTRLFLMEGQSPYSEETTQEIQRLFYGRPAHNGEDQVLFVYPFYSIFLFSPFALIPDYNIARAVWMTVLEVSVILLVAVSLSLNRWRLSPFMLGVLLLFACLWYYTIRALINANAGLLIALVVFLSFIAIRERRDGLAGLLLALATVKPQMVVLLIALILVWSISNRRWIIFWSFLGNLALLTAVTSLLIPNWIWQNLVQIFAYPDYTLPTTPGEIFAIWMPGVGMRLGYALTVILVATLIYEWRQAWGKDFHWLLWTASLTLAITQLVGLPTATENYMIMFPALLMVFAAWDEQWRSFGKLLIFLSYFLFFFGVWWLFLVTLERGEQPIQGLIMFFPLPVFLLIGLYWVRWWVLRPEQPLLDRLRHSSRKQ
jgi:hypothetical protein